MRTDRFMDIGALATFDRLVNLDLHLSPVGLRDALIQTVPTPARSLATFGGNLCIQTEQLNLLPLMSGWDARFELRKQSSGRFIPASTFLSPEGELILEPGEILTRIRLPLGRWNRQSYVRMPGSPDGTYPPIAFCGLARVHRNQIEELSTIFILSNRRYRVTTTADAKMIGQRVPISAKIVEGQIEDTMSELQTLSLVEDVVTFKRFQGLTGQFLRALRESIEE